MLLKLWLREENTTTQEEEKNMLGAVNTLEINRKNLWVINSLTLNNISFKEDDRDLAEFLKSTDNI